MSSVLVSYCRIYCHAISNKRDLHWLYVCRCSYFETSVRICFRGARSLRSRISVTICFVGTYQKAGYATLHPYRSDSLPPPFFFPLACQLSAGKWERFLGEDFFWRGGGGGLSAQNKILVPPYENPRPPQCPPPPPTEKILATSLHTSEHKTFHNVTCWLGFRYNRL